MRQSEQETIIDFNEAEPEANIYTYNATLKRQLDILAKEYPEEVQVLEADGYGAGYRIPKGWLEIDGPKATTEAQKRASRENARKANRARWLK